MGLPARVSGNIHSAAPLVMLHGFGSGGFAFDPVIALLGGKIATICPDLPGHADSLHHPEIGGAGRIAKAVISSLDELGVGAFHLSGHSLGGAAAVLIALRNPDRVKSLTLIAPGGIGPEINSLALARYAGAQSEQDIATALAPFFAQNTTIPSTLVKKMAAARKEPGAIDALQSVLAAMLTRQSGGREQGILPMKQVAALPMPIRVLWGDRDGILPFGQAENLPANMVLQPITGAGHMLMDEAPAIVAGVLIHHCAEVNGFFSGRGLF